MITRIEVANFKSILKANLSIGSLNLFTGINGSGKSSFLQALLLLRQSWLDGNFNRKPYSLNLGNKDSLVGVGTFKDILCHQAIKADESISFKVSFDKEVFSFKSENYDPDNRDANAVKGMVKSSSIDIESMSIFSNRFQYLGAERIQPVEDYPRFSSNELLGKQGEYTPHFLQKYGSKEIAIPALMFDGGSKINTIAHQVNSWMGEISESIEVLTNENLTTNRIELAYRYKQPDGTPSQNLKPQNVGFGITHTLPIVTAILSALPGDIILIENPETHLHPRGQSRLAQLLALASENGIQLFVETHSDHIINGIRLSLKKSRIAPEKVFINFFSRSSNGTSRIQRLKVDKHGGLDEWPAGFFDEWDNILNDLL